MKRLPGLSVLMFLALILAACGGGSPAGSTQPSAASPPSAAQPTSAAPSTGGEEPTAAESAGGEQPTDAEAEATVPPPSAASATGGRVPLTVWTYLAPDDPVMLAYEKEFEAKHPNIDVQHTALPEDDYQTKVTTALEAHDVPDVAFIENRRWMKAGEVVDLTESLKSWGVDPKDFHPGGLARLTWDLNQGIFAVGDFLGGNVIFYNKDLFDQAGIPYPPADKSLTTAEFAELCTKLAKPDPDPTKTVWGCSMPDWALRINAAWVFGKDGRMATGNLNSQANKDAYDIAAKLARDGTAVTGSALDALGGSESDLFAQGKLAMTWSDFTDATKYKESGVKFGIMPFFVPAGQSSFVDTWTAPWGTFNDSQHKEEAMDFLHFIATDAQRLRPLVSSDPPLSMKVAKEINWGKGDPATEEYLKALSVAPGQPFVPPLQEGSIPWDEVWNQLQEDESVKAGPLLDDLANQAQAALDEGWKEWDQIGK
jgi:multiple sugar transport system substrate-binding protein